MTECTHCLVPFTDTDVRTVGAYPQSHLGRVTAQTVRLLVTGNTTLQILPGRRGMAEDPESLIVMVRAPDFARGVQAEADVASPTERFRVMAGAAVAHSAIGFGSVGGQEVDWVEGRGALTFVAAVARAFGMARGTVGLPCRSRGGVCHGEIPLVEGWGSSFRELNPPGPAFLGKRNL